MQEFIKINREDTVAVALKPLSKGSTVASDPYTVVLNEDIPQGHKFAVCQIPEGAPVVKYGCRIGYASRQINPGDWGHIHNVRTALGDVLEYQYEPQIKELPKSSPASFMGYKRGDGGCGVRNELWILPTVGCVNSVARAMEQEAKRRFMLGNVEDIVAFAHPYGCSQMGEDQENTRKVLADIIHHPNAGGVLVLGLGCENLTHEQFLEELGDYDKDRVKFLICQEAGDEFSEGRELLKQCAEYASQFKREPIPVSELVIGMKCGGSDGLSGITANPAVGRFSDMMAARGGSTVLTEGPEMFGAEGFLMNRCVNEAVFEKAVDMINGFKNYFISHNEVVYDNPSPGNRQGGITTLEDKSCGCVQKGGTAPIMDVIGYGDPVTAKGLNMLYGPGNDLVSATAMTAAGAHMILFTTGRGTPFGAPAPTLKLATNSQLAEKKKGWIDFDAGPIADGESIDDAAKRLLQLVIETADGKQTKAEEKGFREISIFKDGVVL